MRAMHLFSAPVAARRGGPAAFTLIELPFDRPAAAGKLRATPQGESGGFTLIELLVVIAILSLLVSILLPSLQRARDLARDLACTTNLHGIGVAHFLYVGDNDSQTIWPAFRHWDINRTDCNWKSDFHYRWELLPGVQIFNCPRMLSRNVPDWDEYHSRLVPHVGGYGLNCMWQRNAMPWSNVNIDQVGRPGQTVFLADNNGDWPITTWMEDVQEIAASPQYVWMPKIDFTRHDRRAMVCFVDGHVDPQTRVDVYPKGSDDFWYLFRP